MSTRSIYLAKSRVTPSQRAHFAIFIPDISSDRPEASKDFKTTSTIGTKIHVVGEPIIAGFMLEIKRCYECWGEVDLQQLVYLGRVDAANLYDDTSSECRIDTIPRSVLEREASMVAPPPNGQSIRASVDGVKTRRCQEWTMEYLQRLVQKGYLEPTAVEIAQGERDPPDFGIFGAAARGN
ncbi:hypothetical protein F5Y08DRAFT_310726 [Xylaria arbuscula]|uniref:Uncharacterized protein n=1 Tax=Xylaria arbuscula TaxID=114810 RepID=A0A9W8NHQ8_9PEZI|nr:hypothetical protein F5Y08DRAFT_310726 [Xylaria arbuscula]KAJ3576041.1 hypothetical protein NPX13_g3828 [Xylaria arbuscula]